jgi:glycosyltransferase involved in cell wall biosynthesis
MNLMFFSHSAQFGGSERVLYELVHDLIIDHKCICTVVLPKKGPLEEALKKIGSSTLIVPYKWWTIPNKARLENFSEYITRQSIKAINKILLPHLKEINPDIIWTQSMVVPWGAMIAEKLKKPHVWYITEYGFKDHGMLFIESFNNIIRDIKDGANLIYTCSRGVMSELFKQNDNDTFKTLYCLPKINMKQTNLIYFQNQSALKIGVFGFISPNKNQEDIVKALALGIQKGHSIELILVGKISAEYKKYLDDIIHTNNISSHIHFTGELSHPFGAMNACDVVVSCTKIEAFGRTPLEAMMLGKAVICPNVGGSTEYVIDNENGSYYTPGNPNELLVSLEKFIYNPSLLKEYGDNGQNRAKLIFNKNNFADKVHKDLKLLKNKNATIKSPQSINKFIESELDYIHIKNNFSFHKKKLRIRERSQIEYLAERFISELNYYKKRSLFHFKKLFR